MTVNILAIFTPKPDRVARLEELARECAAHVKDNEPGTLKYQWFKTGTKEQPKIVVYADKDALNAHAVGPKLKWLLEVEKKEQNLAAPLEILPLEQIAGFASRDGAKI
ncbi:uncharacterized protein CTHT_0020870 [Thermochaetoides thermophila DSM 1495]|uniref:ABM domain-containing protein n=1 Tax=Chaetomium thermophilum (strain DSM 1495 / CBS 144.50 / IMI 039719) TaxID=759272 RepID=G0S3F9_CHATD|nr:hypothetical protein CTHT_0020870 [Thermochaetoides thermophila DSM 1495]EGS22542.1 hypothetical protein CTHT_0020870 [Thermochaetoides thermophila DSM 1495]